MLKGFREFILRGNVVDLAVAVVIGAAFGAVVAALVKDLVTPLIAAIAGKPNFGTLKFTVNHSTFLYGDFINAADQLPARRRRHLLLRRPADQAPHRDARAPACGRRRGGRGGDPERRTHGAAGDPRPAPAPVTP